MSDVRHRAFLVLGALAGALGVVLSAVAAHRTGGNLGTAAQFLLFHAPVLLLLAVLGLGRVGAMAGWVLVAGLALFCGDLAMRAFVGDRLFAMAAPAGGMLLIAGWLGIGIAGAFSRRG